MSALNLSYLRGLERVATEAFGAKGRERNRCVHQLLTGARAALAVVEAVDRIPAAMAPKADSASEGLPTELVLHERRHERRGWRVVLRARWRGEGAQREAVVSIDCEHLERDVWRSLPWAGLTFVSRELDVVARFFADAADAGRRAEGSSRPWS